MLTRRRVLTLKNTHVRACVRVCVCVSRESCLRWCYYMLEVSF